MNTPDITLGPHKVDPIQELESSSELSRIQIVDPIQYGWSLCNPGVPFPRVLGRSAFRDPTTDRTSGKLTASRMAIHSGILRRRMPRPHGSN